MLPNPLIVENRELKLENTRLRDYLRELLEANEVMEFLPASYEKMARDMIGPPIT
jgi:hypothetical protein